MSYSCKITVVKIIFFHFTLLQVFESESQGQLIVPKESNVPVIINSFYENFKGENRIKLHIRIRQFYTGISALRTFQKKCCFPQQRWTETRHCQWANGTTTSRLGRFFIMQVEEQSCHLFLYFSLFRCLFPVFVFKTSS